MAVSQMKVLLMRRYMKTAVVIVAIALFLELFIFNFRAFESLFFPEASRVTIFDNDICPSTEEPSEAAAMLSAPGTYTVLYPSDTMIDGNGMAVFPEDEEPQIMIAADDLTAKNLLLDVEEPEKDDEEDDGVQAKLDVKISASDEGSAYHYDLPQIKIYQDEPASRYIKLNLSGKVNTLLISFPRLEGLELYVHDIKLNARRPFMVSPVRIFALTAVMAAAWFMRPSSSVWRSRYSLKKKTHLAVVFLLTFGQLIFLTGTTLAANRRVRTDYTHHRQYYKLAVALTEGNFYLEDEPSEGLMAMENPYDRNARRQEGVYSLWDTAYYNGRYYCYFGILPVLTYYLPCYIVLEEEFPAYAGILIHLVVTALTMIVLLDELFRQSFPHASLGEYIAADLSLVAAAALLVGGQTLTFYVLPVSMALMLTVLGIYFWLSARRDYRASQIIMGAVCLALTAACRPQFALASFLVFPLLGGETWRRLRMPGLRTPEASKVRRKTLRTVAFALLPYIVVAVCLMYYNAARFGSPFDFGANYNLTTNDMTHRGFHPDRFLFGFFTYLLQLPNFTGIRPYMQNVAISTAYQGLTVFEGMQGGLLWFAPLLLGNLLLLRKDIGARLRAKKMWHFAAFSLFLGLSVVGIDIQVAGILQRYWMDFGFFMMLSAVICVLAAGEAAAGVDGGCTTSAAKANHDSWILYVYAFCLFVCILQMAAMWGVWMYRYV